MPADDLLPQQSNSDAKHCPTSLLLASSPLSSWSDTEQDIVTGKFCGNVSRIHDHIHTCFIEATAPAAQYQNSTAPIEDVTDQTQCHNMSMQFGEGIESAGDSMGAQLWEEGVHSTVVAFSLSQQHLSSEQAPPCVRTCHKIFGSVCVVPEEDGDDDDDNDASREAENAPCGVGVQGDGSRRPPSLAARLLKRPATKASELCHPFKRAVAEKEFSRQNAKDVSSVGYRPYARNTCTEQGDSEIQQFCQAKNQCSQLVGVTHGVVPRRRLRGKQSLPASSQTNCGSPWLREVGHTLQPAELGGEVVVLGDGWGGKKGSAWPAVIIEADDFSFTVVALQGVPSDVSSPWQQVIVLREHCVCRTGGGRGSFEVHSAAEAALEAWGGASTSDFSTNLHKGTFGEDAEKLLPVKSFVQDTPWQTPLLPSLSFTDC